MIKVIMIAHASHSYFAHEGDDLKKIVLNDWYYKTASQLQKFHPEITVECWAPEKMNKEYETYEDGGITLRFFPTVFSPVYGLDFSFQMLLALREEVEKSYAQGYKLVIHLHECHNLHGLIILDLFRHQKIIVQHHGGSWPLKHLKENFKKLIFFPFFLLGQLYESRVIRHGYKFYALSEEEMKYLRRKNCNVVFRTMGIEDDYFEIIDKEHARKKLGINLKEKSLLFLGRISKMKGLNYLLDAMQSLPGVQLYVAGYGKEREELERYAQEKNLSNVIFLGGLFGHEKLLHLSACDALVLPSLKEGAPVTVMEAMARNKPCVVSDVGGVKMMIEDGKNGIIIPRGDVSALVEAITKILSWKEKDIQKYANVYKWKQIIADTVRDYTNE